MEFCPQLGMHWSYLSLKRLVQKEIHCVKLKQHIRTGYFKWRSLIMGGHGVDYKIISAVF